MTTFAPLLEWLLVNLNESKSKVKAMLQDRGIRANGKCVTQLDHLLKASDRISVSGNKKSDLFRSRYVKIVYEDRLLVAIEKNIGILSTAAGYSSLNMGTVLDDYFRKTEQKRTAYVAHRPDRDTSGLMIYAKDMQAEQLLEYDWYNIVYNHRYIAVVSDEAEHNEGTIVNRLKDNKSYITYNSPVDNGRRHVVTYFHVLDRMIVHNLVEYQLEAGRENQIRVHSAGMGHPAYGDTRYGSSDDPLHRFCPHAYVLCFHHPVAHQHIEFEAPIPVVLRHLFE